MQKLIIYRLDQKGIKLLILTNQTNYLIENSKITVEEALKRIGNIHSDINKVISMQSLNLNQVNVLNILFMVNEIFTGESESFYQKNLLNNQILQICLN